MAARRYDATWDDTPFLDADCIASWGAFEGYSGDITFAGLQPDSICFQHDADEDSVRIAYDGEISEVEPIETVVTLDRRPCRFGGSRTYFRCPWCGRSTLRLAILAVGPRCGRCGRITWSSRRQTANQRLVRKANRVAAQLGLKGFDEAPVRPSGMRTVTYLRLENKLDVLRAEVHRRAAQRLARAGGSAAAWATLARWGM